jgi:hypothetical protein
LNIDDEKNSINAYLLFDKKATVPSISQLNAILREQWPDVPLLEKASIEDDILTFAFPEERAGFVSPMGAPLPWPELEAAAMAAWWWPDAVSELRGHRDHIVVALMGGDADRISRGLWLTQLAGAVAQVSGAIAVYWPSSTVLLPSKDFISESVEARPDSIPITVWVNFQLAEDDDGKMSLFTAGMHAFDMPEIEVHHVRSQPVDLVRLGADVANYMVLSGEAFVDGEVFGRTEDEVIKVSHGPSLCDDSNTVIRLELEGDVIPSGDCGSELPEDGALETDPDVEDGEDK